MNSTASGSSVTVATLDTGADPLGEFGSESREATETPASAVDVPHPRRRTWGMWALAVIALVQMPLVTMWLLGARLPFGATTGTVHIETVPSGAQVRMDGRALGITPLALSLDPGSRTLEVQYGDVVRPLPVTLRAGEVVRQRIEFVTAAPAAPAPRPGALSVTTEPARAAAVVVDGEPRGTSPVVVSDLAPGEHTVSVRFPTGTVERTIRVEPGATASFVATMPPAPGAVSGWVAFDVRQPLDIFEQGRLVGTTEMTRVMLPAGEHTLDFVNDELGFRTQHTIRINPGATTTLPLDLPRAPLAINALPWASVWLDGQPVGDTPIGNLSTTIGRHEVLFRHPELGERRATVLVTLRDTARISVDLRRND